MKKKKRFSVLKLLIVILCITSVIVSTTINVLFAGGKTPEIFNRYIYVVGEDNPMSGTITTGSALISMDAKKVTPATGDIVLCYPADNPKTLSLRSISFIADNEDGSSSYYTMDSFHEDTEGSIEKNKIVAICTGYNESLELGRFIIFARSLKGIIILLGIPAILLIIVLFATIASSRRAEDDDEDEYGFYEYDEEESRKNARSNDPLYEPKAETPVSPAFERRKMSIAENFKQKEVNPDSPYQKEKERTVQFKAQKGGIAPSSSSSAESSFAARNPNSISSPAPTAETLREEMLRKTADKERTGTYNIKKTTETVSDNTGILTRDQVAELRGGAPVKPADSRGVAPKRNNSPDISDILGSTPRQTTKKPSDMSVDDLLKIIEEEKKKY